MSDFITKGNPFGRSSLVAQITKGLTKEAKLTKRSIHGADAAFCSRKSALHQAIADDTSAILEPQSALYFAIGNGVHDTIRDALDKSGILIANEYRLSYGAINGFIDDIVISTETGSLKIIDVKTCGRLPTKIKVGQAEQLLTYALLSGIWEASILYVSRNVSDFSGILIKELRADMTKRNMTKIARVVAESLVAVKRKIVPPRPEYRLSSADCGWCPFKDNGCWSRTQGILPLTKGFDYDPLSRYESEIADQAQVLLGSQSVFYSQTIDKLNKNTKAAFRLAKAKIT